MFRRGLDPALRRIAWKHLLNVYPENLTGQERIDFIRDRCETYLKMRQLWQNHILTDPKVMSICHMVFKDVRRTDRQHIFYEISEQELNAPDFFANQKMDEQTNSNVASLFRLLVTYALNHKYSYCQGMSDLASPILFVMKNEAQAYITFCALMKRLHKNFSPTGTAMNRKFRNLKRLLSYYDPEFYRYLINEKAEEMLFSYRWILLDLKREFPLDNVPDMLEVLWASIPPKSNVSNSDDMLFDTEHLYVPNTQSDCEKVNNYQSTAEIFNKTNDAKVFTPNTKERISKSKSSIVRNSNFFNYDEDSISEFNSSSSYDGDGEYDEPIKKRSKNYKRSSLERSQIKHKEENFSTEEEDDLFLEGRRQVDILSNHSMDHGYSTDQKSLSSLVHHPSRIRSYSLSSRPNKDRNRSEMNLMSKSKSPTSKSVNSMNYLKNSKLFSAIEDIEESCNVDDINEQFNILSARSVSEQILNSTIKKMETLSIDEKNSSSIELISVPNDFEKLEEEFTLISPEQLGSSDAFMLFLCLTLLLQNRDHIMEKKMDRNEIQMYFDSMIRKHNVHDVLQDARYLFHSYLAEWHQNQSKKLNLM
ncbi:TBC1 domain family member 25 [Sarcoptes scabiei]|uniref:TBC1 domain family member 25 n=1 Tax=Sarcoptes scabiei TaxID=52283 RepID=A0A834VIQ1_SARSC|nr:TBC1 domain family member 25 [Sarcoptes scabiei]